MPFTGRVMSVGQRKQHLQDMTYGCEVHNIQDAAPGFRTRPNLVVEPFHQGNLAKFVSHSCLPNLTIAR